MTRVQRLRLAIATTGAVLVACVGPTRKPLPLSSTSEAAKTQLVLEESYWATMDGVVVHLPYGVYRAELEDERGVYYRAPYPIKRKWVLFGSERLVEGGIFVPKSSAEKWLGMLWVYLERDDGPYEVHQLPGPIHSGEGSLWRIEVAGSHVEYEVRAECSAGSTSGRYELVLPNGTLVVSGFFEEGQRHGLFEFYRSTGEKVAEIPYIRDEVNGTVELWYGPEYGTKLKKLTARYSRGDLDGTLRAWYPDGSLRERSIYVSGDLSDSEIRDDEGRRWTGQEAREYVEAARAADQQLFETLTATVRNNQPACNASY